MKKQTKQTLAFLAALALLFAALFVWQHWPRSMAGILKRDFPATDFTSIKQFNVEWTPPGAPREVDLPYPRWTLPEEATQPLLDILLTAKLTRDIPGGQRNAMEIGEEGIYSVGTWCFHFSVNQQGLVHLWNNNYRMDDVSFQKLWPLLTASNSR